jgi:hypothetical protein
MAVVITATAGSASANSFVTLAEAETYMEARLNATLWDAATEDTKNRALVEATREIDVLSYIGRSADDTQALSWPRQWAINPDDPDYNYFLTTDVPQRIKNAQMELAFQFIKQGTTDVAALDSNVGIKRKKIDVIETEYSDYNKAEGLSRYPRVLNYLMPLLDAGYGGLVSQVIRG